MEELLQVRARLLEAILPIIPRVRGSRYFGAPLVRFMDISITFVPAPSPR
jgi:hypothetical protein